MNWDCQPTVFYRWQKEFSQKVGEKGRGVPIMHQGECVGGVGVSSVKSHEDEQIAKAGLLALG
jgi:uncharacterized protein GlcG (DUF336 family)